MQAETLLRYVKHQSNASSCKKQPEAYLKDKKLFTEKTKPMITQWYAGTYKGVDRFDQSMGYIPFPYKPYHANCVLFWYT